MSRVTWSGLLAAAAFTLSAPASACFNPDEDGTSRTVACITSIHAGVVTTTFGTVDGVYAAERKYLPTGWAVGQLILGGFGLWGGGIATMAIADNDSSTPHPEEDILWGVGLLTLGSFHGAIATWNLERYRNTPAADDSTPEAPAPTISIAPTVGGAVVSGTF